MPAIPVFHGVFVATQLKVIKCCLIALSYFCNRVNNLDEVTPEKFKSLYEVVCVSWCTCCMSDPQNSLPAVRCLYEKHNHLLLEIEGPTTDEYA